MIESTDVPGGGATTALRVFAEVIDPVDPNGLIDPKDLRTEEAMIVGHALQGIVIAEDLRGGDRPPYSGGQRGAGARNREAFRKERPRKTRQEILASLPNFKVQVIPEEKGVALLAKRIRLQGRAYPLFDIAHLITQSLDRFRVRVSTVQPNGTDVLRLCGFVATIKPSG